MLPRECQVKGAHHHQALDIWNVEGTYLRKWRRLKTMNNKVTTNSQLWMTEPNKEKQKLSKQLEQESLESQKWRSHGGLSTGEWEGERWGKCTENK